MLSESFIHFVKSLVAKSDVDDALPEGDASHLQDT
jgi:hypothetical protein